MFPLAYPWIKLIKQYNPKKKWSYRKSSPWNYGEWPIKFSKQAFCKDCSPMLWHDASSSSKKIFLGFKNSYTPGGTGSNANDDPCICAWIFLLFLSASKWLLTLWSKAISFSASLSMIDTYWPAVLLSLLAIFGKVVMSLLSSLL